jgi:hypothetical protein
VAATGGTAVPDDIPGRRAAAPRADLARSHLARASNGDTMPGSWPAGRSGSTPTLGDPGELLGPHPATDLVAFPVGSGVNSVRLDGPALVAPTGPPLA